VRARLGWLSIGGQQSACNLAPPNLISVGGEKT